MTHPVCTKIYIIPLYLSLSSVFSLIFTCACCMSLATALVSWINFFFSLLFLLPHVLFILRSFSVPFIQYSAFTYIFYRYTFFHSLHKSAPSQLFFSVNSNMGLVPTSSLIMLFLIPYLMVTILSLFKYIISGA